MTLLTRSWGAAAAIDAQGASAYANLWRGRRKGFRMPAGRRTVSCLHPSRRGMAGKATAAMVRHATLADLTGMVAIVAACGLDWTRESLQDEIEKNYAKVLVVDSRDLLCAMLVAWLVADEVQILEVAVLPQFRRRGFATLLLSTVLEPRFSDSAGASAWLEVRASNVGAVALYEQLHFTERATRRKYYSDGEDAIVMCKELGQTSTSSSNHRP